jgi:GMP synthase-like glutamine amidotransferase
MPRRSNVEHGSPESAEETIERVLRTSLNQSTWKRLNRDRDRLYSIGAIPDDNETRLRTLVSTIFNAYWDRHKETDPKDDGARRGRYREVANLLVHAGIACPSFLADWSIDRVEEAEDALGIRSFNTVERVLANKYAYPGDQVLRRTGRCRHLHKGPGNGVLMYYLRKGKRDRREPNPDPAALHADNVFQGTKYERSRSEQWQEIGVGNTLYFSLETLLSDFAHDDVRDDPEKRVIIRVLSTALQRALRHHWFKPVRGESNMVQDWIPIRPIDLNDILIFLSRPQEWLDPHKIFEQGKYFDSNEFEEDTIRALKSKAKKWLLRYLGQSPGLNEYLKQRRMANQKERIRALHDLLTKVNSVLRGEVSERTPEIRSEFDRIVGRTVSLDENEDELSVMRVELIDALRSAEEQRVSIRESDEPGLPLSNVRDCLSEVFKEEFVRSVETHAFYEDPEYRKRSKTFFDLNRQGPEMYLHNFVLGKFTGMPGKFPPESFLLMTGVRSDSHENNEEFEKDIKGNIDLLEPGGVLLTDGIRESHSRIYRFEAIRSALHGEVRAEVVCDERTHNPVSVLIQKKHPRKSGGYLSEEEKKEMLREGVYFRSLGQMERLRPDLRIINTVRMQIARLAEGNVNVFNQQHERVQEELDRTLIYSVVGKFSQMYGVNDQSLIDAVQKTIRRTADQKHASERSRYGSRLHKPVVAEGDLDTPFHDLRMKVMKLFNATDEEDVRTEYEEALYAHMTERLYPSFTGETIPEQGLSEEKEREWRTLMLDQARNVTYEKSPFLDDPDVRRITEIIGDRLRQVVAARPEIQGDTPIIGGLAELSNEEVHTVRRMNATSPRINAHCHLPHSRIPSNNEFAESRMWEILEKKIQALKKTLRELRQRLDISPLTILKFAHCATNECLEERIREILEDDFGTYVTPLKVDFDLRDDADNLIRHYEGNVRPHIQKRLDTGGIFFVGGSWQDANDRYGSYFKDRVGRPLLEAILRGSEPVRYHGICFGYQTMADLIGEREGIRGLETESGALEFCPGPIKVLDRGPLFKDCPYRFTVMQTHSGHVCGLDSNSTVIRPLAISELTGLPIAYTAYGDRITGMQAHPEVRVRHQEDRSRLICELSDLDTALQDIFGIQSNDIQQMWANAAQHIKAEAGKHLLVNALLHHSEGLLHSL